MLISTYLNIYNEGDRLWREESMQSLSVDKIMKLLEEGVIYAWYKGYDAGQVSCVVDDTVKGICVFNNKTIISKRVTCG